MKKEEISDEGIASRRDKKHEKGERSRWTGVKGERREQRRIMIMRRRKGYSKGKQRRTKSRQA